VTSARSLLARKKPNEDIQATRPSYPNGPRKYLRSVESLKTYIQDAEADGDQELVEFFSGVLENNLEAAQRAKEMLVPRFQREQE
jgi:hypothetical protein